jgi:hypothetical protein
MTGTGMGCADDSLLCAPVRLNGTSRMPRYDRLSILVSLLLFGLVVSQIVELPTRTVSFVALGVPTTIYLPGRWLVGALLVIMTGAGVDSIVQSYPGVHGGARGYTLTFWGLPCTLVLVSLIILPLSPNVVLWLGALALTGLLLSLVVTAQYYTIEGQGRGVAIARWGLSLAAYGGVFVLFGLTYGARVRSLLSATAISFCATIVAAELLRPASPERPVRRTWLYSAVVGLVLGEVAWALNHVSLSAVAGGLFLLLVFYLLSAMAKQYLSRQLTRAVIAEFIVVGILGLGLLYLL